jgi:hypothetical protein
MFIDSYSAQNRAYNLVRKKLMGTFTNIMESYTTYADLEGLDTTHDMNSLIFEEIMYYKIDSSVTCRMYTLSM